MVRWQRHLQCELPGIQRLWKPPSASISSPLYQYFQQLMPCCFHLDVIPNQYDFYCLWHLSAEDQGFFSVHHCSSEETPISSPLTPVLAIDIGKNEEKKGVANRTKVQAVLKKIKQSHLKSPKKVNLVAALIRGMRVEDALLQLQVTVKLAAKTVYQVIHSARADATHNHGLDPRLSATEAFIGKGMFLKRVSFHGKGRSGIKERPEC
ncbi:hypothetical protein GOBAR_DD32776 [Gossypium barbadense]|nr:hypothetical protein GOBAR_DD32776 [Gossypium barbadense]